MSRGSGWRTGRGGARLRLLVLALLGAVGAGAAETNSPALAVWDASAQVAAGFGYRDNVLRTSVAPESSAFFNVAADASWLRLAASGAQLSIILLGDHTQYFDAPSVNYEQFFSGMVQAIAPVGQRNEISGQFNYLYQHQVLDVSETEATLNRVLVDGQNFTGRPYWKHWFAPGWAVQLEAAGGRQIYADELDDYWEAAARGSVIRTYGWRSELSLGYQIRQLWFDSREQFDRYGVALPGTELIYWQQEVGAQWRHHWDAARQWRTTSRLSYLGNRDNGSGYFDYERFVFSEQVRWATAKWEFKGGVRLGWYFYPDQEVNGENRERSYIALDLRVERVLVESWRLYAVVEREWNFSNDPVDEYDDWMAGGGVSVEF